MNYLNSFPESDLYCFEPNPVTFGILETRFKNNSRVHLHNIAVSDTNGISDFYCNKENPTDSLFLPAIAWMQWVDGKRDALTLKSKINVLTTNLDTFCSSNSISKLDILKIDAQGAECLILDGAKNLLSQHAIKIILAEMMFVPVYENQPFFFEICNKLALHGYSLVNLYNIRYDEETSLQIKWGDGLFIYRGW